MDIEEVITETLKELLDKIEAQYDKIELNAQENNSYHVNIVSDNPSLLIGHHGDNIQALQHLLKVLTWRKSKTENFFISLDIENYRQRQEQNAIDMADRKVDAARKTGRNQTLPPMSSAIRRKIHLHLMGPEFGDIETISEGEKQERKIMIKLKNWQ